MRPDVISACGSGKKFWNELQQQGAGMKEQSSEDQLLGLRSELDKLDAQILALLNRRAACSQEIGRIKSARGLAVLQPDRERVLLDRLVAGNTGPLPEDHLRSIYGEIISSSRALQRPARVAFLGPEGTFSNIACLEYFGSGFTYVPEAHLADIFEAVEKGDCDFGIVPLENSVNGSVGQSLDLFAESRVFVQAEWYSRICLSLMSAENALENVRVVYSHAQALGQCAAWLREHLAGAGQTAVESTALAARRVFDEARDGASGAAAIGHASLAGRFGLTVLASGLEDLADNWTRFFVIGPAARKTGETPSCADAGDARVADKSSLVFSIANKPGSLERVLRILASRSINMSKLESRPLRGELWKYIFFADLDCDITAPENNPALAQMEEYCHSLRVLGVYPVGRRIHAVR
jgi:chorismate mutase/prephenate dehydratase